MSNSTDSARTISSCVAPRPRAYSTAAPMTEPELDRYRRSGDALLGQVERFLDLC